MTKKSLSLKRFILGGPRSPARSEKRTSFSGLRSPRIIFTMPKSLFDFMVRRLLNAVLKFLKGPKFYTKSFTKI